MLRKSAPLSSISVAAVMAQSVGYSHGANHILQDPLTFVAQKSREACDRK